MWSDHVFSCKANDLLEVMVNISRALGVNIIAQDLLRDMQRQTWEFVDKATSIQKLEDELEHKTAKAIIEMARAEALIKVNSG
ncbi:Hypothetical predicted protein [Olea europaea subsp. europaea]|uniref:Uncharacterized protein n=1 Tax=Olea europaea subsp. europaea TaxID=158383 RepID=A0A8S0R6G7_OLEEU|nr:Hypothetical predicted protein [Olea europaea subsp. europaea]